MPKATLTFDLPEEQYDYSRAVCGKDAFAALHDIDQMLRSILKHGSDREPQSVYEEIREMAGEVLWRVEE